MCLHLKFYTAESWLSSFSCCLFCRYIIHSDDHNPYLTSMEKFAPKLADFKPDLLVVGGLQMMDSFPFQSGIWGNWLQTFIFFLLCVASSCGWRRSGLCDRVILVKTWGNDSIFAQRSIPVISEEFVACWQMKQIIWLTLLLTLAALHSVGNLWHRWDDLESDWHWTRFTSQTQVGLTFYLYFLLCTVAMTFKYLSSLSSQYHSLFSDPQLGYETTPVNGQNGIIQKTSLFSSFLKDLSIVKTEPFLLSVSALRFLYWWHSWTHGELEVMNIDSCVTKLSSLFCTFCLLSLFYGFYSFLDRSALF